MPNRAFLIRLLSRILSLFIYLFFFRGGRGGGGEGPFIPTQNGAPQSMHVQCMDHALTGIRITMHKKMDRLVMQGSCIYWNSHAWNMYRSQQYYQSVMHCTCIDGNRAHKVLHKLNTYTCVVLPNCTGRYYLVDRMWDWTVGLDSEKVALILLKPHTSALQHTILTSHELNLGEMTMT